MRERGYLSPRLINETNYSHVISAVRGIEVVRFLRCVTHANLTAVVCIGIFPVSQMEIESGVWARVGSFGLLDACVDLHPFGGALSQ